MYKLLYCTVRTHNLGNNYSPVLYQEIYGNLVITIIAAGDYEKLVHPITN